MTLKISHQYVVQGFNDDFVVDGVRKIFECHIGPHLQLFAVMNSCIHPFYLTNNSQEASQGEIPEGSLYMTILLFAIMFR